MHFSVHRIGLMVMLGACTLGGCRSYGMYDSTSLTTREIGSATQSIASELQVASGRAAAATAAASTPRQNGYSRAMAQIVDRHERTVRRHQAWRKEAEENAGDHRTQQWTLGAMLMERKAIEQQYVYLERFRAANDSIALRSRALRTNWYYVAPPYYAMQQARVTPVPAQVGQPVVADSVAVRRDVSPADSARR